MEIDKAQCQEGPRVARHTPHLSPVGRGLYLKRSPERRTPAGTRGVRRSCADQPLAPAGESAIGRGVPAAQASGLDQLADGRTSLTVTGHWRARAPVRWSSMATS